MLTGVNFTNIFEQLLRQYSFTKKVRTLTVTRKKLRTKILYKKAHA
jgi:hypothetical protein